MADLPLRGIRVLDLSRLLPGPFCTLVLSDLGAEVVKVEDPGAGDYLRAMPPLVGDAGAQFLAINRDKRSLVLDLKQPAGRDAFLHLCEQFDVVVESFRPGVLDRLGIGYETLRERNRGLVLLSISGYGQDGPYRDRAGHDLDYVALAGLLGVSRAAAEAPRVPAVQVADFVGGGLWGAVGVLAALCARQMTGEGRHLDLSMTEGALALLIPDLGAHFAGGGEPRQGEGILRGGHANYQVYATRDGEHLAVGALEPKFWAALSAAIGRPVDLAEIGGPPAAQERLRAELESIFRRKTRAEWEALFASHDVCVEPVRSLAELPSHPQHVARRVFFTIDDPRRGPLRQTRTPLGHAEGHAPPPAAGEHSDAVLEEAGFTADDIARLRAAGVVR